MRLWPCRAAVSTAAIHSASTKALQTFGATFSVRQRGSLISGSKAKDKSSVESVLQWGWAKVPAGVTTSLVFD